MSKNKTKPVKEEQPEIIEAEDILAPEKKLVGYHPVTGEAIYQ